MQAYEVNYSNICDLIIWLDDNMSWWEFDQGDRRNLGYASHREYFAMLMRYGVHSRFGYFTPERTLRIFLRNEEDELLLKMSQNAKRIS